MTRHEIATLACKILALWSFAQSLLLSTGIILIMIAIVTEYTESARWSGLTAAMGSGAIPLGMFGLGLFFWFGANRLASRMVSNDPTPVTHVDLTPEDCLGIALSAIGVFIMVPVVRDLGATLVQISLDEFTLSQWWASASWQANLWSSIMGLGFAIWLIVGSRRIARFMLWLRKAGT